MYCERKSLYTPMNVYITTKLLLTNHFINVLINNSYFSGTNMLMVGVHGPKTPCEEVYVKHMGNRMYNVTYTVKEKGDYILIVKWGDEMVPGSPFHVTVP